MKRKYTVNSDVTAHDLVTLASKICPSLCIEHPMEAIEVVRRLFNYAERTIYEQEEHYRESYEEHIYDTKTRVNWASGVRSITGEQRLERASKRFIKFLREKKPDGVKLATCKRDGFTLADVRSLTYPYKAWKSEPKPKTGKQGRRKSASDGRLKTNLIRLVPTKPSKAA